MRVEIKNIGRRNDDEIVVKVIAPNIPFTARERDIELDQDDEETLDFSIPIDKDIKAGEYFIEVGTYYKDDEPSHSEDITLTVTECKINMPDEPEEPEEPDEPEEPEEPDVVDNTSEPAVGGITPIIAGVQPVASVEGKGFTGSTAYTVILVIAVIVAVFSLVLLFSNLMKNRKLE